MRLSDFNYVLPKELIAQYPLKERDACRLLVLGLRRKGIQHRIFREIIEYLRPGDLLVLNNAKVSAVRLLGNRLSGGRAEIFLLRHKGGLRFEALIKPGRIKTQERIVFRQSGLYCQRTGKNEVAFHAPDIDTVYRQGVMPLPPYIKREVGPEDSIYYQTVYAKDEGAVASPTAGLHFTDRLLGAVKVKGIETAFVTLYVGHATFKPVKCQDIRQHTMEDECFHVQDAEYDKIKRAWLEKRRIIAVGTTSCRLLESLDFRKVRPPREGKTNLFIYPGYKFKVTRGLITNFHLPSTTLFMLVSAFAGMRSTFKAYREAIKEKYRFYSYGDAMFII
ncbi:MAG: tRNA preQ1(34) S-adenosylmethionine ribosyltransferase-isomerase QueA [Candidatus Omnitrophota bacterium]